MRVHGLPDDSHIKLVKRTSLAKAFVRPITAALEAEYAASQEAPVSPQMEATFTMLPVFLRIIGGSARRQHRNTPVQFTAKRSFHSFRLISGRRPFQSVPALLTRTSKKPSCFSARSNRASTSASRESSAWKTAAFPPWERISSAVFRADASSFR